MDASSTAALRAHQPQPPPPLLIDRSLSCKVTQFRSMGSVGGAGAAEVEVEAFLRRCAPSADAAYGELRALLAGLHDPATRRQARLFLAALRRRQHADDGDGDEGFFRRHGFCIRELALHDARGGLPIAASAFLSGAAA
ncbi:hypothetical protein ACP70R_031959 [Stipagrostis hirtigluma subsp. patula]